jgi:hypothetical protein
MSANRFFLVLTMVLGLFSYAADSARAAQERGIGHITGIITDAAGKPLSGFSIKLQDMEGAPPTPPRRNSYSPGDPTPLQAPPSPIVATTTTDAQGRFRFSNIRSGRYMMIGGSSSTGLLYKSVGVEANKTTDVGTVAINKK